MLLTCDKSPSRYRSRRFISLTNCTALNFIIGRYTPRTFRRETRPSENNDRRPKSCPTSELLGKSSNGRSAKISHQRRKTNVSASLMGRKCRHQNILKILVLRRRVSQKLETRISFVCRAGREDVCHSCFTLTLPPRPLDPDSPSSRFHRSAFPRSDLAGDILRMPPAGGGSARRDLGPPPWQRLNAEIPTTAGIPTACAHRLGDVCRNCRGTSRNHWEPVGTGWPPAPDNLTTCQ